MHVPLRNRQLIKIKGHASRTTRRILLPLQLFLHTETPGALILLIAAWRHDRTHPAVGKLEDPLHDLLLCRFEHAR
jgi:hypothetical protein